jgi:hypothetical protein
MAEGMAWGRIADGGIGGESGAKSILLLLY